MPPDLPGHYFDPARNKYFKIQPNHVAPAGAKYSQQAIDAAKSREVAQQKEAPLRKRQEAQPRIRRRTLPILDRRLGSLPGSFLEDIGQAWAAGLRKVAGHIETASATFAIEQTQKALFATLNTRIHPGNDGLESSNTNLWAIPHRAKGNRDISLDKIYAFENADCVKLGVNINLVVPISPWRVLWSSLSEPGVTHSTYEEPLEEEHEWTEGHLNMDGHQVRDMAISPDQTLYALAAETTVQIWRPDASPTLEESHSLAGVIELENMLDLTAVRFKERHVLMTGHRRGHVTFQDLRTVAATVRLRHDSAVSHLRELGDGHSILVNGLQSMKIYDLRYVKEPDQLPQNKSPALRFRLRPAFQTSTATVDFSIPQGLQQQRFGLGFEYDGDLGIVATSSTDHMSENRVHLWSVKNGRMVPSVFDAKGASFQEPVTCIQIAEVVTGPKSIFVSSGGVITEWRSDRFAKVY